MLSARRAFEGEDMKRRRESIEDFFRRILGKIEKEEQLRDVAKMLEYTFPDRRPEKITNDEFDIYAVPSIGGNEGWYVDVYMHGSWNQEDRNNTKKMHIGTLKTLEEGLTGAQIAGQLAGAVIWFGRRVLMENNELYASDIWIERRKNG